MIKAAGSLTSSMRISIERGRLLRCDSEIPAQIIFPVQIDRLQTGFRNDDAVVLGLFKPGSLSFQRTVLPAGDRYRQARRGTRAAGQPDQWQHKSQSQVCIHARLFRYGQMTVEVSLIHSDRWHRSPEARLIESAKITVLKTNDSNPCTKARRRILCELTCTSETWQVIPITNEK